MFSPVVVLSEGKATIEAGLPRPSHILHTVAHCHAWIHPPHVKLALLSRVIHLFEGHGGHGGYGRNFRFLKLQTYVSESQALKSNTKPTTKTIVLARVSLYRTTSKRCSEYFRGSDS